MRVVFRVRCIVTGEWKLTEDDGRPRGFTTRKDAKHAARFVKRWRIVKVTIRPCKARLDERAKVVAWLREGAASRCWGLARAPSDAIALGRAADAIERGEHER